MYIHNVTPRLTQKRSISAVKCLEWIPKLLAVNCNKPLSSDPFHEKLSIHGTGLKTYGQAKTKNTESNANADPKLEKRAYICEAYITARLPQEKRPE